LPDPPWDVLVAGAGPAGSTAARILAGRGLRVVLADRLDRPTRRLEVVSPSLGSLLNGLGLLDLLDDPSIARPCLGIRRRWGHASEQVEDFLVHRGGAGHVVDRARFDAALRERAAAAGARFVPLRIVGASAGSAGVHVGLSDRSAIAFARVVDATGRPASVARRLGAIRRCSERLAARLDERLADPAGDAPGWLQVVGRADGWRYTVQGPGKLTESWSISALRKGGGTSCEDASSARLDRAAGTNWVAVGDAAAAFDPVTSQGLANALSTAAVAAGMILAGDDADAALMYSDAVAATHARSEQARREVYGALTYPMHAAASGAAPGAAAAP
jgi:flavin-dependent dehydrogenase